MSGLEFPSNPAELAELRAYSAISSDTMTVSETDQRLLAELDYGAETLGFLDKSYFVEAGRAFILPIRFEAEERMTHTSVFDLTFEGRFRTYSKVHIGRIIGVGSVRAVCLAFTDVTLLPYFDTVPDNEVVYVPALAVNTMDDSS